MEILNDFPVLIITLFFGVAFLYASVGHGGASGYLALMALLGIAPYMMKSSGLMLNIMVSGVSFLMFYKSGYFRWKLFWPFAITSIPASFLGAMIVVDSLYYKRILGVLLIFPVLRLLGFFGKSQQEDQKKELFIISALVFGAAIGAISGMIGIGGGIILSPLLLVFRWATIKESAAVSALFILCNSVSGFAGVLYQGLELPDEVLGWLAAALLGGLAGSYYGSRTGQYVSLKYILAIVLIIASSKLIMV